MVDDDVKDTRRKDALAALEGRHRRDKKKKSSSSNSNSKSRYSDQPASTSAGVLAPLQKEYAKLSDSSDEHKDHSDEALDVSSAKLSESPLGVPHIHTDETGDSKNTTNNRVSTASSWAAGVIKAFLGRPNTSTTVDEDDIMAASPPVSEPAARTRDNSTDDDDNDLEQQLRKVRSLPTQEVNRISMGVERVLQRARKQLLEMDDYLSRNEEPGLRDSGIQHSDDEPPAWQAESTSLDNRQSQHSNRDSIAPSLRNRRSLYEHYSPVLGKATHVEIASSTNTAVESDTTTSSSYHNYTNNSSNNANSSFNNSSSLSNSTRSGPRNISLREVRENTEELESLLTQIQDLRRSTSDRRGLSQRLQEVANEDLAGEEGAQDMSDLQRQSAKRYRKRPVSPRKLADHDESPEDFSSSSFENRQATPPRTSTPSPPAELREHGHEQQQQAVGRGFRLQAPPTPPKRRSDPIENVTAWTPQIEEDQRSSDIASIPSASSSHQHNRSASLPHASASLPALVARANTTTTPTQHASSTHHHHHQNLPQHATRHKQTPSGSGADFEGMMDLHRTSLPPLQHANRRISSLSQLSQTSTTYGSPVGSPLHNPPARPIPPTPTTVAPKLPPISQQWMTPTLGEEMDQLLEAPHPPFVKSRDEAMHSKRSSHDSSAESFKTAYSPSDLDDGMESEVVQDTIIEGDMSGTVKANSESTSTEGEHDKEIEAVLDHEHETESQGEQEQRASVPAVGVAVSDGLPDLTTSSPYRTHTRNLSNMSSISSTSTSPLNFRKGSSDATGSGPILAPMKSHRRNLSTTSSVISRTLLPEIPLAPLVDHNHARVLSNGSTSTVTAKNKLQEPARVSPPLKEEKEHDKKEKEKKKKKRSDRKENSSQPRPFSQTSVQQLMNLADDTFRLDELDLPPDERHLLEKFIDALSKLSVEIHMDERKKVEGKRRLQNALRAIEGWI